MHPLRFLTAAISIASLAKAYDQVLGFNDAYEVEHRSVDEIYRAALAEGGVVTCWHGGDERGQQDVLKQAFEAQFPGMTLNLTIDFSKYHGARLDRQLAVNNVYVDSIISQSLHDYPRWRDEDALLRYKPLGFEMIRPAYRDSDAAFYGVSIISWSFIWNTQKSQSKIASFDDFLKPEYKNKLALTYPNDDDAVLFAFDLILDEFGISWFEELLKQNPMWVRGTATPANLIAEANSSIVATFTSTIGLTPVAPFNISFPTRGQFTSWAQGAAILKDAPHPEGAKLLHAFYLSEQFQRLVDRFSVRTDITVANQPLDASDSPNTDPTAFQRWTSNRPRVERLRNYFEDRIGTAQGPSPLAV